MFLLTPLGAKSRALSLALLPFVAHSGLSQSIQESAAGSDDLHSVLASRLATGPVGLSVCHPQGEARADSHAPIGVMADHSHGAGEWMLSLRWMRMEMDGLGDGTRTLDPLSLLGNPMMGTGYLAVPLEMTMDMLMLGGMVAPSDQVTLMAMVPYLDNSMNLAHTNGQRFSTESSGLGDIKLAGLFSRERSARTRSHWSLGLSVPTG